MGDEEHERDERDELEQPASVTLCVDVDADVAVVWDAVADPERRQLWLDDDDAVGRLVHVEHVDEGRTLSWTWWHPGDEGAASRVDVHLTELDGGGTRVLVHERLLPTGLGAVRARAMARSTAGSAQRAGRLWATRLFGLELLLAASRIAAVVA